MSTESQNISNASIMLVELSARSHLATLCALAVFKLWEALRHERAVARPNTAAADMADPGMWATTQGLDG